MGKFAFLVLVAAGLCAAGPAAAATKAACLWRDLPAERQAQMIAAAGEGGSNARAAGKLLTEADVTRWKTSCGMAADEWPLAGRALIALVGRERSTRDLATRFSVDAAALDAAWNGAEVQALLPGAMAEMRGAQEQGVIPPSLHKLTMALYRSLGSPDGSVTVVFSYAYNRVVFEETEAR